MDSINPTTKTSSITKSPTSTLAGSSTTSLPPSLPQRGPYEELWSSIKDLSYSKKRALDLFTTWVAQNSEESVAGQLFDVLYELLSSEGPLTAKTFVDILFRDVRILPVNIVAKASDDSVVQLLREIIQRTPECQTILDFLPMLNLFGSILLLCIRPKPTYHEQNRIAVLFKSCAARLPREHKCLCLWVFTRPDVVQLHSTKWTRTFLQSLKDIYVDQFEDHKQAFLKSDLQMLGSQLRCHREPLLGYKQFRADAELCGYSLSRSWSLRMVFRSVSRVFWKVGEAF